MLNLVRAYRGDAELVLVTTSGELIDAVTPDSGVEAHLVTSRRSAVAAIRDHRAALRPLDLDLLQVTRNNPFAARPAVLAGLSLRLPTIAVEQLVLPARRRRGRLVTRAMAAPLAGHVAVGRASADDLRDQFGIPRDSITVVHNGVPDDVQLEPTSFPMRPVVGCAARFEDQKRIDLLLQAAARLPAVHIVLVGDGSRRVALEQLATSLGIDERLTITGWKPDARRDIAGFDVFVLPSRDEAFPLTIVEAMLSSTPVVATDVGSVREAVIDGETGLLVPPGDVGALAAAIGRVLDEPGLGARLAANARAKAANEFTSTAMAAAYDRLWSDVLARRSTSH
jgi:glycosyltransferase involved in cell wall biosynthesis